MEYNAIRDAKEMLEVGMVDKVSSEDSGGSARWQRCRTTGMDTAAEEMWNGNRWDVRQHRWLNGLEGRRQTGKILTSNNYQHEDILLLQDDGDGRQGQQWKQRQTSMVAEMRDNRYGCDGGGDAGQQQKRCGTTEMARWVGRTATAWANINREQLPTWGRIVTLIT